MKRITLLLLAGLLASAALRAEDMQLQVPPTPTPTPAPGPRLTGRWGVGFDSIPGASTGTGLIPGLASPNAVAVRYWINERLAWDGLLALDLSSQPSGGPGTTGVPAGTDQRGYGAGTLIKFTLKRPSPWLLAQAIGRASMASLTQLQNDGSNTGQTTTTLSVGVALGFEAFFPVWDSLSVEGSLGLNFSSSQTKPEGPGQVAQSGSSFGVNSSGFTPTSVSVHLYF